VVGAKHLDLDRLGLLDAENHLGLLEHRGCVGSYAGALGGVLVVGDRAAGARAGLGDHLVSAVHQLAHAGRRERDAVLVGLDLSRNPDLH
jgi:hypothetical protein